MAKCRAKMLLEDKSIYEWDVIVEKDCGLGFVRQKILIMKPLQDINSLGVVIIIPNYCPGFGDGAKITVHLNMNKRTLAFTVNGTKYPVYIIFLTVHE